MKQQYDNSRNTSFTCDCREYTETSLWGLSPVTYFNTWKMTCSSPALQCKACCNVQMGIGKLFWDRLQLEKRETSAPTVKRSFFFNSLTFRAEITEDFVFALIVLTFWPWAVFVQKWGWDFRPHDPFNVRWERERSGMNRAELLNRI